MKQFLIFSAFILLSACNKEEIVSNPELTKQLSIPTVDKRSSYTIWIRLPDDYHATTKTYPTMYVLDADENQSFVAKTCKRVSDQLNMQNVIVVGINYGRKRDLDYTPTVTDYGKGGSQEFMQFIKNSLIPRIQAEYRADTLRAKRIIIGHSFGGLFGAYAFTKHNKEFGNYLLLSPSLFYDNSVILNYEQAARPTSDKNTQLVFIGLGGTEGSLLPANELFYKRLLKFYPLAKSTFQLVPGRGHLSSKEINIENAINFYFKNR